MEGKASVCIPQRETADVAHFVRQEQRGTSKRKERVGGAAADEGDTGKKSGATIQELVVDYG